MTDWLPSLNALRAFECTARHLNYRKAAEELHVSPAAVKQLVRKLEEAVGRPLLLRQGRGLALAPGAVTALPTLSRGFGQIAEAVETLRRREAGRGLVITSDPSFAALWLVPRLPAFRKLEPEIGVLLDSSPQIADLRQGAADLALRFGQTTDDGLVRTRLFDETLGAYCSPALAEGEPGLRSVADLARLPLIRWDLGDFPWAQETRRWNSWRHWLAAVGAEEVVPGEGLRFNDYNLAVQAAIAGQGVILGSRPVLHDLVIAGLLVSPLPETAETGLGYDLVMTPGAAARPEVTRFRDWILAAARADDAA